MSVPIGTVLFGAYFSFLAAMGHFMKVFLPDLSPVSFVIPAAMGALLVVWLQRRIEVFCLRTHVGRNPKSAWAQVTRPAKPGDNPTTGQQATDVERQYYEYLLNSDPQRSIKRSKTRGSNPIPMPGTDR